MSLYGDREYQVKKTPCYNSDGTEFYPIRNYETDDPDWVWIPGNHVEFFLNNAPYICPSFMNGQIIGGTYVQKPKVSQELLIGVVSELVSNGAVALNTDETPYISELLKILNLEEKEETSEEA